MNWYYLLNEEQIGPVTGDEILQKAGEGVITQETLVWREGMAEWLPYSKVANEILPTEAPAPETSGAAARVVDCPTCGRPTATNELIPVGNTHVCPSCKEAYVQSAREGVTVTGEREYGGFWIRAGATMVDGLITGAVMFVLMFALAFGAGAAGFFDNALDPGAEMTFTIITYVVVYGIYIAYFVFFNGHPKYQATPGKMAFKLRLIVADGSRVTYLRAFGRFFAYILSGMVMYIGYIMAAFDEEKRSLHDRICNTRVIRTR